MSHVLSALWAQPAAKDPPRPGRRDVLLAGAVVVASVVEAVMRVHGPWRPVAVVIGVSLGAALLFRRTRPLRSVALGFGVLLAADAVAAVVGTAPLTVYAAVAVLVLAHALLRWGSGRDIMLGTGIMAIAYVVAVVTDHSGASDAVGGAALLLLAAALGVSLRYRATARDQLLARTRLQEREQLARELHDVVAHHVSGIAVQAQAGLAMARSGSLAGASDALQVIDRETVVTLDQMRTMVGTLRDPRQAPDLSPQAGIADLQRLVTQGGTAPTVDVTLRGDLTGLSPSVATTVYRIAQESVTNARRHAQRASRVEIIVTGTPADVQVTVADDGVSASGTASSAGYGLVGMTERVTLLGGTLEAGPEPHRGWVVRAVLPRSKAPA